MKKGSITSTFGTTARINHDSSPFYNSRLNSELPINEGKVSPTMNFRLSMKTKLF